MIFVSPRRVLGLLALYVSGIALFAFGGGRDNAVTLVGGTLTAVSAGFLFAEALAARLPVRHAKTWARYRRPLTTTLRSRADLGHLREPLADLVGDAQRIRRIFHAYPFRPRGHVLWLLWDLQRQLSRHHAELEQVLGPSDAAPRLSGALARLFDPPVTERRLDGTAIPSWLFATIELERALYGFVVAFSARGSPFR